MLHAVQFCAYSLNERVLFSGFRGGWVCLNCSRVVRAREGEVDCIEQREVNCREV